MISDYPDKPAKLHPHLKARQGFIRLDSCGGQIGNLRWNNGDPAGVQLQLPREDQSPWPVHFFGSCGWNPFGWAITAYTDDVAAATMTAVRRARYLALEA